MSMGPFLQKLKNEQVMGKPLFQSYSDTITQSVSVEVKLTALFLDIQFDDIDCHVFMRRVFQEVPSGGASLPALLQELGKDDHSSLTVWRGLRDFSKDGDSQENRGDGNRDIPKWLLLPAHGLVLAWSDTASRSEADRLCHIRSRMPYWLSPLFKLRHTMQIEYWLADAFCECAMRMTSSPPTDRSRAADAHTHLSSRSRAARRFTGIGRGGRIPLPGEYALLSSRSTNLMKEDVTKNPVEFMNKDVSEYGAYRFLSKHYLSIEDLTEPHGHRERGIAFILALPPFGLLDRMLMKLTPLLALEYRLRHYDQAGKLRVTLIWGNLFEGWRQHTEDLEGDLWSPGWPFDRFSPLFEPGPPSTDPPSTDKEKGLHRDVPETTLPCILFHAKERPARREAGIPDNIRRNCQAEIQMQFDCDAKRPARILQWQGRGREGYRIEANMELDPSALAEDSEYGKLVNDLSRFISKAGSIV